MLLSDFIKQDRKVQELEANALCLPRATNQRPQPTRFASRGMSVDSALFEQLKKAMNTLSQRLHVRDAARTFFMISTRATLSEAIAATVSSAPSVRNFPMSLNKMNSPESKRGREIERRDATSRNHDDRRGGHQAGNLCQSSNAKDAFTRCWRPASLRRPTAGGNGDRSQYYHPGHCLRA
jgi:hypothetical protein